ncbi:hypothetical protein AB0F91_47095 [Amycolatopsis sp. NPDC023774]|uniref:hypothetical protein n=1 Tax=Amycolatopsis sp. NPDC023774 TaxID=3155015 RepID=UPI0033C8E531
MPDPDPLVLALEAMATQPEAHRRDLDRPAVTPVDLDHLDAAPDDDVDEPGTGAPGGAAVVVAEDAAPAWARVVIDTAAR